MSRRRVRGPAAALGLLMAACGAPDAPAATDATATARDSAGVRIVTNPDVPLPVWTVDSVPAVTIGTADGADGQDLGNPRTSTVLPDGRVAISDYTAAQVRFYDAEGRHLRSVGGRGSGPGEFNSVSMVYVARGDSLVVSDSGRRRLTILGPDGSLGRVIPLDGWDGSQPLLRGVLDDSVVVFRAVDSGARAWVTGEWRDSVDVFFHGLGGGPFRRVGRFPGALMFQIVDPDGNGGWGPAVPFNRDFEAAVTRSRVWIAEAEGYGFRLYDAAGSLRSIVRLERAPRPVEEADRERWREGQRTMFSDPAWQERGEQAAELVPFPETFPPFSNMLADAADRVWVAEYQPSWSREPLRWRVFDAEGQQLATAILPAEITVQNIGEDLVLGRWTSELGVPHVGVFPIRFGEGGREDGR